MEQRPGTHKKELELDINILKKGEALIRAIDHQLRQKILKLIHEHGRLAVKEIYGKLRLKQSDTSLHLSILRKADMVVMEKVGRSIYYSVNYSRISYVQEKIKELPEESDKRRFRSSRRKMTPIKS